jgi:CreA protein
MGWQNFMKKKLVLIGLLFYASAGYSEVIGETEGKGWVFKDKIKVIAVDDPDIKGITCYTTYYDRSLSLSDSSNSSIACRETGVKISGKLFSRKNIFKTQKSFFRATTIDRFYDAKRNVLVYLSSTKGAGGGNATHSISVVALN